MTMSDGDRRLAAAWAGDRAYWSANPCEDCHGWVQAVETARRCLTCRPSKRIAYFSDDLLRVSTWRQEVFSFIDIHSLMKPSARRILALYAKGFTPAQAVSLALSWRKR